MSGHRTATLAGALAGALAGVAGAGALLLALRARRAIWRRRYEVESERKRVWQAVGTLRDRIGELESGRPASDG